MRSSEPEVDNESVKIAQANFALGRVLGTAYVDLIMHDPRVQEEGITVSIPTTIGDKDSLSRSARKSKWGADNGNSK